MILLANVRVQAQLLYDALDAANVPYARTRTEPFIDELAGRCGLSILRILDDEDDLVAHRVLLGLPHGTGPKRCLDITTRAIAANLSATDLFRGHVPAGVLTPVMTQAVNRVRAVIAGLHGWTMADPLSARRSSLGDLIEGVLGQAERAVWDEFLAPLPAGAMLSEVLSFLFAETAEEVNRVHAAIAERLLLPPPEEVETGRVSIRTMHGAKGLSAKVVFIPGLEDEILPGPHRAAAHGLVQEGARLLYVSLTRARAAVICSYAGSRLQHGQFQNHAPSRYLASLGLTAAPRTAGLSPAEAQAMAQLATAVDA
jgi:DNA helicase-2/ATP-dependent DNA helicase PcrA